MGNLRQSASQPQTPAQTKRLGGKHERQEPKKPKIATLDFQTKAQTLEKQRLEAEAPERERQAALAAQRAEIEQQRQQAEEARRFNEGMANQAKAQQVLSEEGLASGSNKPYIVSEGANATVDGTEDSSATGNKRKKRNQLSSLLGV